jgi:predicted transcriptional regulator
MVAMARRKSAHLTDAELRLMDVLWDKGPCTVSAVIESLPAKPALAYSTVITTLRILETKGYVRHKKEGRAFIYEPVVGRDEARHGAVTALVRRFFDGSPDLLMAHLFEARKISARELERLRKLVAEDR